MTAIEFSLFAIAVGAILRYAVTAHPDGIDLVTVGPILIVVGGIGLVVGVWLYSARWKQSTWTRAASPSTRSACAATSRTTA